MVISRRQHQALELQRWVRVLAALESGGTSRTPFAIDVVAVVSTSKRLDAPLVHTLPSASGNTTGVRRQSGGRLQEQGACATCATCPGDSRTVSGKVLPRHQGRQWPVPVPFSWSQEVSSLSMSLAEHTSGGKLRVLSRGSCN